MEQRCLTAEQALSVVLKAAAFLASYRMLTVRNIAVEATRFEAVKYELDLGPLNAVDSSALSLYQDVAHRRKARLSNSQSIVLARDEDKMDDCLNLSPFIVDKNTFVSVKRVRVPTRLGWRISSSFRIRSRDGWSTSPWITGSGTPWKTSATGSIPT